MDKAFFVGFLVPFLFAVFVFIVLLVLQVFAVLVLSVLVVLLVFHFSSPYQKK